MKVKSSFKLGFSIDKKSDDAFIFKAICIYNDP